MNRIILFLAVEMDFVCHHEDCFIADVWCKYTLNYLNILIVFEVDTINRVFSIDFSRNESLSGRVGRGIDIANWRYVPTTALIRTTHWHTLRKINLHICKKAANMHVTFHIFSTFFFFRSEILTLYSIRHLFWNSHTRAMCVNKKLCSLHRSAQLNTEILIKMCNNWYGYSP